MRTLNKLLAFTMALVVPLYMTAQTEIEPNDGSATANMLTYNTAMSGSMGACSPTDNSGDYFRADVTQQGQLRVQSSMSNTGTTDLEVTFRVRHSSTAVLATYTLTAGANGVPVSDSFQFPCQGGTGTYYITLENPSTTVCTNYSFSYDFVAPIFGNDPEPNDGNTTAVTVPVNTQQVGQINFHYGDNSDYYRLDLPTHGVLNIQWEAENVGASGTVAVTLRNSSTATIQTWNLPVGAGSVPASQTVSIDCRSNTGFYYLSMVSSNCGVSYRFSYTVTPPVFANDAEPNDGSTTAIVLPHSTPAEGQINFSTYTENSDYYRIDLPTNGILNISWQAEHASATPGTAIVTLHSSSTATIQSWNLPVGASSTPSSQTVSINCRSNTNFYYLSVVGVSCGISYRLSYTVTPPIFANDAEPNDGNTTAIVLPHSTPADGQINFSTYVENSDYYRLDLPSNGILNINWQAEHASATPGTAIITLRANSTASLQSWTVAVGANSIPVSEAVSMNCRGNQNFYYLSVVGVSCGISYRLSYTVTPPIYAIDPPTGTGTATAAVMRVDSASMQGQLNFFYGQANAYYRVYHQGGPLVLSALAEHAGASAANYTVVLRAVSTATLQTEVRSAGGSSAPLAATIDFGTRPAATYYVEVLNTPCGMSYAFNCDDADGDGVCNYYDLCANTPTGEGVNTNGCSCSQVVIDDGDVCTLDECLNGDVTHTFQDADNDLTCDANDGCPNDPNKIAPGQCGCGVADTDSDGDLTADCNDGCPNDPNKIAPGICGCGVSDVDSDGDLTADCNDGCPNDPNKIAPGICGCGVADMDSDGDLTADCNDGCPNDPNKTAPGNCGCGNPEPGASCDDGNANTTGDVILANCTCQGTPIGATDCNGVIGGPAQPGTPCDDLDACTVNDVYTGAFPNCGCAGTFADADNDGTCDANDGCPNDPNKIAPGNCGCGVSDVDSDGDGTADCNDGCPNDPNKVAPGNCGCGNPEPGASCDDGNANTVGDVIQANCTCAGTPIGGCDNELLLEFQNATNPGQVTWEVLDESGTITVDSGTDVFPASTTAVQPICLADGCYQLRITDAAGDGLTGYELRESGMNGRRIIDNTDNSIAGTSAIANGGTFCLPIGDVDLISSNCDKQDWVNYQYLVCHADAAVSAVWVPNGSNNVQNGGTGYAFWIFDPNGSYSFRRFHAHNTSDGFSPASATRAAHLKINGWNNTALTPHIPADVLMNVRVRPVVMGSLGEWGATCTMKIDPVAAACPRVHLQDDPAFSGDYSCGVTREFGGSNRNANKLTAKPPQFQPAPLAGGTGVRYQFRFRLPSEGFCVVRPPQTSPRLFLNWNTDSAPVLEAGKTYEVEVRVSKDQGASWCVDAASPACDPNPVTTWGKVCNVTISGVAMLDAGGSDIAADNNGTLTMYPNPNNGEQLFISLTELAPEVSTVSVDIHDLTGKRITARTIAVQDGFLNTALSLNGDVASGVYVVSITAGDKAYTERLVIQK